MRSWDPVPPKAPDPSCPIKAVMIAIASVLMPANGKGVVTSVAGAVSSTSIAGAKGDEGISGAGGCASAKADERSLFRFQARNSWYSTWSADKPGGADGMADSGTGLSNEGPSNEGPSNAGPSSEGPSDDRGA